MANQQGTCGVRTRLLKSKIKMIAQHLLVHQTVVSLTAAAAVELATQWVVEAQRPQRPQWSAARLEGLAQVNFVTHNFVTVPVLPLLGDLKKVMRIFKER
jgi:hypothetical protein